MRRFSSLVVGFGFAALLIGAGCRQGEGERCQVTDDCESPLVCNVSTDTCQTSASNNTIDAGTDTPLDGEIDSAVDALAIDALVVDAAVAIDAAAAL